MTSEVETIIGFQDLGLSEQVQEALKDVGYEVPSPIQARLIPFMMAGRDVFGQAQTGTGKTAAFALPLLSKVDLDGKKPQILVMTPTRELAIQVAEAFKKYAARIPGFKVVPIYGGQEYGVQLRALRGGVHVVVGTPGRVMDHMERGTLNLDGLTALVLDEADEMLKMGFKEDIEWILDRTPGTQQIALFSATLPAPIRTMARKYLKNPEEIIIKAKTSTVEATRQRYLIAAGYQKPEVLARVLEAETYDAVLVFVRTKLDTVSVAEKLINTGLSAAALNGDVPQNMRERIVEQLKSGKLNILVATDVAARGLDVERISLVVNYDIPYDVEAYIHRIGRTGRAGRSGDAILFVAPRERRMLQVIERATRQTIEPMDPPSVDVINAKRVATFKQRISTALAGEGLDPFRTIVEEFKAEHGVEPLEIAAALARMVQGTVPLFFDEKISMPLTKERVRRESRETREPRFDKFRDRSFTGERKPIDRKKFERDLLDSSPEALLAAAEASFETDSTVDHEFEEKKPRRRPTSVIPENFHEGKTFGGGDRPRGKRDRHSDEQEPGMARYRVEVGRSDGVQPGNLVGAIAGETGLDSKFIGRIKLFNEFSTVDLPDDLPAKALAILKNVRVGGRRLDISLDKGGDAETGRPVRAPRPRRDEEVSDEARPPKQSADADEQPDAEKPKRKGPPWSERPLREDRPSQDDRPPREARPAREERGSRDDRPPREDRPVREKRFPRDDRPARSEHAPRAREEGQARVERTSADDRPARPRHADDASRPRTPRETRPEGRFSRDRFPKREESGSRAGFSRPRKSGASKSKP